MIVLRSAYFLLEAVEFHRIAFIDLSPFLVNILKFFELGLKFLTLQLLVVLNVLDYLFLVLKLSDLVPQLLVLRLDRSD